MKQLLRIITFVFLANFAFGQTSIDTVYFDANWGKASKNDYHYCRVLNSVSSDVYEFKDYWKSGEILKSGRLSSTHPQTREGEFTWYHKNGKVNEIVNYKNNHIIGPIQAFDSNGKFDYEYISVLDSLDNASEMEVSLTDFRNHISQKINYPKHSRRAEIEGKVMVQFSIDASGKGSRLRLTKAVYKDLDREAIRVIESFNKWPIPKYKGKNTNLMLVAPIEFRLAD
jgi:TonB family protein